MVYLAMTYIYQQTQALTAITSSSFPSKETLRIISSGFNIYNCFNYIKIPK